MSLANVRLDEPERNVLLTGNEALARGALEAGVAFVSSYPGSPSVEVPQALFDLSEEFDIYGEWSTNEIVALEAASAAAYSGLRAMTIVKQNGLLVASDYIFSLNYGGTRGGGGFVIIAADDPSQHSSSNELDVRQFARSAEVPLLEPSTFQEAKDMVKYAFELSEQLSSIVMVRTPTRLCHARGNVVLGGLDRREKKAYFRTDSAVWRGHQAAKQRQAEAEKVFEQSRFNYYSGPSDAKFVIATSGTGWLYSQEALRNLNLTDKVGIIKVGTGWPLPPKWTLQQLANVDDVMFIEEVDSFLETNVKTIAAQFMSRPIRFHGQTSGEVKLNRGVGLGEMNTELVEEALHTVLGVDLPMRDTAFIQQATAGMTADVPDRATNLCAGCPHRASFWAIKSALEIDGRDGFVCGDIGCYSSAAGRPGFFIAKTGGCMGAGTGVANGFGQLSRFGFDQPVIALSGDSTFYHAVLPALINARYNGSKFVLIVLDNGVTAMTGHQPHPGVGRKIAGGGESKPILPEEVTRGLGIPTVVADPYQIEDTTRVVFDMIKEGGPSVIVMRRECALNATRGREKQLYAVNQERCKGDGCGCERFCSRVFACPALYWDSRTGSAKVDDVICIGCGVCASLCPYGAIEKVTPGVPAGARA